MHWELDKGTGERVCLKCVVVLLAILSLANSSSVLSDGDSSAGADDTNTGNTAADDTNARNTAADDMGTGNAAADDTNTGNTAAIEVDDVENDVGDDVIVDAAVEKEGNLDPVDERIRLYQYDPVEVGHIRYVEISLGRYVQLKTIAVKPPAFEISNFLTPEECERIKELALDAGLLTSLTVGKNLLYSGIDETKVIYNATEWKQKFAECDNNTDKILDFTEVLHCLPGLQEGELVPPAILDTLYVQLKLDLDSDGLIDAKELWLIHLENKTIEIEEWLSRWRGGELPKVPRRGRHRISEQAWIEWENSTDPTIMAIRDRVTALTKLDRNIVFSSESLQVVRYYPGGHYHAHYDSQRIKKNKPCIHSTRGLDLEGSDRLCRYITILYYLQNVEGGGETAFPLAEFENVSIEYRKNLKSDYDYTDLKHNCYKNLNVKPEFGKAIMWYNYYIDEATGWMSSRNTHSLHGGCEVTEGTKWIANNWITVDDVYERQMELHARRFQPTEDNKKAESENETGVDENDRTEEDDIPNEAEDEGIDKGEKESNNDNINDLTNDNAISTDETHESTPSTDKTESDDLPKGHTEF
ncbi:transmembrane prolyl 4-hydroxylase isoform X1 [Strongylocentrotus purpuratus]|uniref:Fe2OG dioxygenase domain-containing protein n=1 Tax=Strongylocentrotus purpuratus TaxID=7668 RepID=A0A7M7SYQ6_STRPU|nr:transmembrane prolyl 4-hydroxylase isoform X1 [Strongylocentrotus purpuratus]